MNKLERYFYDLVKKNPALKNNVRNLYQSFFDMVPKRNCITEFPILNRQGYFFGFHDHSPFSDNGEYLLAQKAPNKFFMPTTEDKLTIGFFYGENHTEFEECATSSTWNWHMGCKLQWVGETNSFIFNDIKDGKGISRLVNIESKANEIFDCQLSSISRDGNTLVGYDFFKLESFMPGYGYRHFKKDYFIDNKNMKIFLLDLRNNIKKEIFSVNDLKLIKPEKTMNDSLHYLSHALFSPCSKKFCFLHRWIIDPNDIRNRKSRLIICSNEGEILSILPSDGMFSHFCWRNDREIIGYCSTKKYNAAYHLFSLKKDGSLENVEKITNLLSDGHPSTNAKGNIMITDSYPNALRLQSLYVYDFGLKTTKCIGKFLMPEKFQTKKVENHWCVDLHPRLNKNGTMVCFDNAYSGVRSLATIDISSI